MDLAGSGAYCSFDDGASVKFFAGVQDGASNGNNIPFGAVGGDIIVETCTLFVSEHAVQTFRLSTNACDCLFRVGVKVGEGPFQLWRSVNYRTAGLRSYPLFSIP